MRITSITPQTRNDNRVNIFVDGSYRFSLDIYQLVDLNIKVGHDYDESDLISLEQESQFGKVYGRALEYCLIRPRSIREIENYLYRKTKPTRDKMGELRAGVAVEITTRIFDRLLEKGYIDDEKFAEYWVENRLVRKGSSRRKLVAELYSKGVSSLIVDQALEKTERNDKQEIQKIILKKRRHYPDDKKMIMYLARLGFDYETIKQSLNKSIL